MRRVEARQIATHHHPNHLVVSNFFASELPAFLPIPQNDNPIGKLLNLAQTMRNIDDAHAFDARSLHDSKSCSVSVSVRLDVGSSIIRIFAFNDIARAISTIC